VGHYLYALLRSLAVNRLERLSKERVSISELDVQVASKGNGRVHFRNLSSVSTLTNNIVELKVLNLNLNEREVLLLATETEGVEHLFLQSF
jgi:hypothetical protein